MGQLDLRAIARNPGGTVLGLEIVVVSDPLGTLERTLDRSEQIDGRGARTCGWFEGYLARGGRSDTVRVSPIGQAPSYLGRTCCFQHLTSLEHRLNSLPMPHETTCQGCQRVFRIQWAVTARR